MNNETIIINIKEFENELLEKGKVETPLFTAELLPRRKGKTFVGFRGVEGTPRYSKRVKFTSTLKLKNRICK